MASKRSVVTRALLVSLALGAWCLPLACSSSDSAPPAGAGGGGAAGTTAADRLKQDTGAAWVVDSSGAGNVEFAAALDPTVSLLAGGQKPEDAAIAFVTKYKDLFGIPDPAAELRLKEVVADDQDGSFHVRFQQVAGPGVTVLARELGFHFTTSGSVGFVQTDYVPGLAALAAAAPKLDAAAARTAADAALAANDPTYVAANAIVDIAPELVVYTLDGAPAPVLAWHLVLGTDVPWEVVVDAASGGVVTAIRLGEASKTSVSGYGSKGDLKTLDANMVNAQLYDLARPASSSETGISVWSPTANGGRRVVTARSSSGPWDLRFADARSTSPLTNGFGSGTDALAMLELVDKWYRTSLGRKSWDGRGTAFQILLHDNSLGAQNAFWDGRSTVHVGDGEIAVVTMPGPPPYTTGNGTHYPYSVALDVMGHELTHAVTQSTAGLVYQGQSGALNESQSDIFGAFIEHTYRPGAANLTHGEDASQDGTPDRDMLDPTTCGQPDHMTKLVGGANTQQGDWGGVHSNSGIPNAAWGLATAGGTNKTSKVMVEGEGWDASREVWWRLERWGLSSGAQFKSAARASTAIALFTRGAKVKSVACAWYAVGVFTKDFVKSWRIDCEIADAGVEAGPSTQPPPPPPPPDMDAGSPDAADVHPDATTADVDAGPPTDHCTGRADGTYCSITSQKFFAVVCKNQQLWGAQYCPNPNTQVCVGPNGPGDIVCQ